MENEKLVDSVEALMAKIEQVKKAQEIFATYSQEQVDKIFTAAALAANNQRIPLAKMAVAETGMGIVEDKVIKNHYAAEYIYNTYKNTKTVGVIEEDASYGVKKIAEPIGVVAAVIPTTNPTSTAIFKTLICLKTRNGIIISPHPRAKGCTIAAAKVVLEAAVKAGAPEGIIGWIDVPSLEMTNTLMKTADIILATGGPGMVRSAYSSGKPALGVGAGNTPAIIDETADITVAVNSIIHSKTFDNGLICASEQSVIAEDSVYDAVKAEFLKRGCYFLNEEEKNKVRSTMIINGALNAKIVGQRAPKIAEICGFTVPDTAKILIGEVESVDLEEAFAHEKLSPVLALYRAKDFDDAVAKAERLIADGGYGHTASLHINAVTEKAKIAKWQEAMKTCRMIINMPSSQGAIGDIYNFKLTPSLTLGCGSWGGNSVSENVGVKHLLNIKTLAERKENMLWLRLPEKVYHKRGCLPVALDELKTVMGKKKARQTDGGVPARRDHRLGRRLRDGRRQDHVGAVRASRSGLPRHGHALYGYPQARVHLPEDGRKGVLHRHPHLGRYRFRSDAVRRHHRRNDGHQVPPRRLRTAPENGDRRRGFHDEHAQGPHFRVRYRRADARA